MPFLLWPVPLIIPFFTAFAPAGKFFLPHEEKQLRGTVISMKIAKGGRSSSFTHSYTPPGTAFGFKKAFLMREVQLYLMPNSAPSEVSSAPQFVNGSKAPPGGSQGTRELLSQIFSMATARCHRKLVGHEGSVACASQS